MTLFSQDVVSRMNQAMQNSDVDISFRLVHAMPVDYTTTSDSTTPLMQDLEALQSGSGPFAEVHTARADCGADIVAMLVDHGSASGRSNCGAEKSRVSLLPGVWWPVADRLHIETRYPRPESGDEARGPAIRQDYCRSVSQ
jgi:hypothetical protein